MKSPLRYKLTCGVIVISSCLYAQLPSNKVKPGIMYHEGDTVRSPRLGIETRIPEGWSGVLPRDTEVFLLMPTTNIVGEIYVMVNENTDNEKLRKAWQKGIDLGGGLMLQPKGNITNRGSEVISATGEIAGNQANHQGLIYAESKASPAGFCLTFLSTSDPANYKAVTQTLQTLVDNTVFGRPTNDSPYLHFNWQNFLSGKILLAMGYDDRSKRIDEVDLCSDGSFRSKITRTGLFKDQAKSYQGTKSGSWQVLGEGEKATITFTFKKLPEVKIELHAKDEEIYINGQRYFVGESERCQTTGK